MSAPFCSIITDITQDVVKVDQLTLIFRFVKISAGENRNPLSVEICKSFVGFMLQLTKLLLEFPIKL